MIQGFHLFFSSYLLCIWIWHIGLILQSADSHEKVRALLDSYTERVANEFHASLPAEAPPVG